MSVGTECNLDDDHHVIVGEDVVASIDDDNKQSKVFNDLENYLKYLLEPPKIDDNNDEIKEITIMNKSITNNNYDLYLKKNIIKFLLDSYTNITLKQDFTKISTNYFVNLTKILNSNEFNQEQVSYMNIN